MKRRLITVAALACLMPVVALGPSAAADTETPAPDTASDQGSVQEVIAQVQPSVVYVQMNWTGYIYDTFNKRYLNDGQPFPLSTQCTGYVVNPDGYVATAGHCVDPKGDIIASMQSAGAQWALDNGYYSTEGLSVEDVLGFADYRVEGRETKNQGPDREVLTAWSLSSGDVETGENYTARVLKFSPFAREDTALLKIEANDLVALPLADDADLEVGSPVVAIGYPASVDLVTDPSLQPSFKDGTISSTKTINGGSLTVYEISAAMSGGMSGGPSVNLDGEVVGFNSYTINGETQSFNFVRPSSVIVEMMADQGVANELGEISTQYRVGIDALYAGDKAAAVENLTAVTEAQPDNTFAREKLAEAEALPDPAPEAAASEEGGDSNALLFVLIGIGLLVALVAAGIVVILRGRRSSASPGTSPAVGGAMPPGAPSWPGSVGVPSAGVTPAVGGPVLMTMSPGPAVQQPIAQPVAQPIAPPVVQPTATFGFVAPVPDTAAPAPVAAPVPDAPAAQPFCAHCGTASSGLPFCAGCGQQL